MAKIFAVLANWRHGRLDETIAAAGPRLRALRQRQEITLAELSAATGISVSTLSRLESGARRPTLELLLPLARTFGVTLDELVDAPPTGDPAVHLRPVQRGGMTMLPLSRRAGGVQAYKIIISPAAVRRSRTRSPTRATSGSTSSTGACASSSASTTWC
jgi:transcriptional regulator with XRE-family HTH domain